MARPRHTLPWENSAGHSAAACDVMVCSPYNSREADCLAWAEPLLPRCTTTGSLKWGPVVWAHSPFTPLLATVAAVQMDKALRRLEMRLSSHCQCCGAHYSEERAFRYLGLCQALIIQKILNLSVFLKNSVPYTFLSEAPNAPLGVMAPCLAEVFVGSCVAFVLKCINLL